MTQWLANWQNLLHKVYPQLHLKVVQLHNLYEDQLLAIDQTRLEQILVNLIGHALDAMAVDTPAPPLVCRALACTLKRGRSSVGRARRSQ